MNGVRLSAMKSITDWRISSMSNVLVTYFSAGGVTKRAAERLAKAMDADLFEIKPAVPYSGRDLDWTDRKSRSSVEMKDPSSRPEIAQTLTEPGRYDTVFIGFPIWWYTAPTIIKTFLESCDLSGKTLIPFATSGGSGMGNIKAELSKVCPDASWKDGRLLNRVSDDEIKAWAMSISDM